MLLEIKRKGRQSGSTAWLKIGLSTRKWVFLRDEERFGVKVSRRDVVAMLAILTDQSHLVEKPSLLVEYHNPKDGEPQAVVLPLERDIRGMLVFGDDDRITVKVRAEEAVKMMMEMEAEQASADKDADSASVARVEPAAEPEAAVVPAADTEPPSSKKRNSQKAAG